MGQGMSITPSMQAPGEITVTYGSLTDTASLTVNHGTAQDVNGDSNNGNLDQRALLKHLQQQHTILTVTGGMSPAPRPGLLILAQVAFGSGSTYTSNTAGVWIVVGIYSGLTSTSTVTVNHAPAASITVGSSSNSITAGATVTFTPTASDVYGNL